MKIAVCFSGMIRTGIHASSSIKQYIGDLYDCADFFMHTWDVSQQKQWCRESVFCQHGAAPEEKPLIKTETLIGEFSSCYDGKFVDIEIEQLSNWYINYRSYRSFSPQWYSWAKSVKLKSCFEKKSSFVYDFVVKLRPDIVYPKFTRLAEEIEFLERKSNQLNSKGYESFRVDDVFFISDSATMDKASMFLSTTPHREWYTNIFGDYLKSVDINCGPAYNQQYAPLRDEAIAKKENFNLVFNIDRDYYSPAGNSRLPVNNDE